MNDERALDQLIFPGGVPSRTVREQRAGGVLESEAPEWSHKPKIIVANGVAHEFYYISTLAKALNRQVKTLYKWEENGWLPRSRYRTKAKLSSLPGKSEAGRRLYTRDQIEAVVKAAKETGVYELSRKQTKGPDWHRFTRLVVDAWNRR